MKTHLPAYWKIYAALLAIFVSGSTLGYVTGQRSAPPLTTSTPSVSTALSSPAAENLATTEWAEQALAGLEGTLDLTPEQSAVLRPVLERTGSEIFRQRDRALFRIYLEVMKVHDELAPYLDPAQQKKLVKSKENMHLSIESRFKSLLDQPDDSPDAR